LAKAVVPRYPGVTSALGCVICDMRHDFVQTVNRLLAEIDVAALDAALIGHAVAGMALLDRAGVDFAARDRVCEVDMSYVGQTHTIAVRLPLTIVDGTTTGVTRDMIGAAFEARYRAIYGRLLDGVAIRLLNLRVMVIGIRPKLDLALLAPDAGATIAKARRGTRPIHVDGARHEAQIYERLLLPIGARIVGPAILEQPDATIFVEPGLVGEVDAAGNFIMAWRSGASASRGG
jgi:N-methylhydantoinase A